jgi:hypothetical protein
MTRLMKSRSGLLRVLEDDDVPRAIVPIGMTRRSTGDAVGRR